MPPLQVDMIGALRDSLQELVDNRDFKALHLRPIGANQAPEFPYIELMLKGDDLYEPKSKPGYWQWAAASRMWIIVVANTIENSEILDLAGLIDLVRAKLAADGQEFTNKSITITSLAMPQDPEISVLIQDLMGAVIEVRYEGVDNYTA